MDLLIVTPSRISSKRFITRPKYSSLTPSLFLTNLTRVSLSVSSSITSNKDFISRSKPKNSASFMTLLKLFLYSGNVMIWSILSHKSISRMVINFRIFLSVFLVPLKFFLLSKEAGFPSCLSQKCHLLHFY